ncbi:MAG: hypothetical protein JWQ64_2346 [Subtercola sp.]|nr:hypothetical protein [Subtercola sp.]
MLLILLQREVGGHSERHHALLGALAGHENGAPVVIEIIDIDADQLRNP